MLVQRILFLSVVMLLHYSCLLHLAISSSNLTDQSALLAIQSKLTFDPTNTVLGGNWTTETSFCTWFGVSCSKRRQRVTALNLSYMGLQGTISPHIGNLSFLVLLDLGNNSFTGSLPHEIGRLHRLKTIVVQANQLEGTIPPALQHCQKLEILSLSVNRLGGQIPIELGFLPKLRRLYLGLNNFVAGNIPAFLGNISTLQELALPDSGLTGPFPRTLLNLSSLVFISLYKNNISGSLHDMDICHYWPTIHILQFDNNIFSGKLPSRIDGCREIALISLSNNRLIGSIPQEIGALQNLEWLAVDSNYLTGFIPPTIGNLSKLIGFSVDDNYITGSIPKDLGRLSNLQNLSLANNSLTGAIPFDIIFNISSLQIFSTAFNSLSGTFPSSTGVLLPNIEGLYLSENEITGAIPAYFSNFTKLRLLDLSLNLLYGAIPMSLGSIQNLHTLALGGNQLTGEPGVLELRFLSSIFNSSSLRLLGLEENPLNGIMPDSFRNLSYSFQYIYAPGCQIKGHIPSSIGFLKNLTSLDLQDNNVSGNLPSSIGGLEMMYRLHLDSNNIEGLIPDELCLLRNLGELLLSNNNFSGLIPSCIANLRGLQKVLLNSNRLTSAIPMSLWNLENLLFLNLSFNSLSGALPSSMRKTKVVQMIDLSSNQIRGNIPTIIGEFQSLSSLNLSNNMFVGSVPQSFGDLKGLELLDLSYNNLSGTIPKSLEMLKYLKYLNLSYNKLSGEIPSDGPFVNFSAQSFLGNTALCQRSPNFGVSPCRNPTAQKSRKAYSLLEYIFPAIISIAILVSLISWWNICHKRKATIPKPTEQLIAEHIMISYHELCLATNNFCESNLLGVGSFGSVYKGLLSDGLIVAVKVLNLTTEGAFKSFDAECKVWRTIRHRNVVKVITTCSSPDVRALVLEYMPHGSLEKWLYSHNYCLSLLQRVSVLIDIASALEYLHHGQSEVVVHCDLKPSNILLDEDMVAHVADFGLGKVLAENKEETQTRTLGTLGYIAPEYGSEGKVSAKGDIYSFGIMLFEILTRKKPTDDLFFGELTLRQWINASIPERVIEVVDSGLLSIQDGRDINFLESIVLHIMELGLKCTLESPEERVDIKEVVSKLNKIKLAIFHDRTLNV